MRSPPPLGWRRPALCVVLLAAACRPSSPHAAPAPPPPAEFVLSAGDSAFWVSSIGGAVHVRGAPLELARVDGRFYEVYVADDDHSYGEATFIGQRVYRRDLVRGDSAVIYQDAVVPRLAREYGRRHPDDAPLTPGDEPSDEPRWSAVASLDVSDLHGPFVSFVSHMDVERKGDGRWHTTRRGVIDLRRGGTTSLAAVVGAAARLATVERQRGAFLRALRDSARATSGEDGARAAAMLPFYRLDPDGFSLTTIDGAPAVAYALAGTGDGDAGHLVPLTPIPIGEPAWWPDVAATLPVGSVTGARDVWRHGGYEVVVHYDSATSPARLALRDSTSREWTIARVPSPVTRIFWLDAPAVDSAARRGLARAFDESSLYDESVRTASIPGHRTTRHAGLALARRHQPVRLGHARVPRA